MKTKFVLFLKRAVQSPPKQPCTFNHRVGHRSRFFILIGLALAFAGPLALASNKSIPGSDIVVKKNPSGITVGRGQTNQEGTVVFQLEPGDYASTINTSRKHPSIVIEFSGSAPVTVSVDLVVGKPVTVPFTVPAGKKRSVTFKITETAVNDTSKSTIIPTQPASPATLTLAQQKQGTTVCTCPSGWTSNTTNTLGGVTTDGKCRKMVGHCALLPLEKPPYGTAVGSWGIFLSELFMWGTPQNGGAPTCVTH